jgi:hypothetical protein
MALGADAGIGNGESGIVKAKGDGKPSLFCFRDGIRFNRFPIPDFRFPA